MPEFFRVRSVSDAVAGFRPGRRTPAEVVPLALAAGRVPVADVTAPADLPGFARSTVDGFAVRAADTFGASEGLPAYLDVLGEIRMGEAAGLAVRPGGAVAIPTGGAVPDGADAVVMVEHTQRPSTALVEVTRPAAPGQHVVGRDHDYRAGAVVAAAGRALRAAQIGALAAAGVAAVEVHRRPRVALLSTGDEVVPAETPELAPGQVRDANAPALAALVREAGGEPWPLGIVPDDPEALEAACREALAGADLLVVSAGSSVGERDATARVVARLGEPGIWCHGLALRPGKPTLLADVGGRPVIGLPGNPVSALVVFRLVGQGLVRRAGGLREEPAVPVVRATLARDVASAAGRLDVVQVRLDDGRAEPVFGGSALLSTLAGADGYVLVPEPAGGLYAGDEVEVALY